MTSQTKTKPRRVAGQHGAAGHATREAYDSYRKAVPAVDSDRDMDDRDYIDRNTERQYRTSRGPATPRAESRRG